MAVNAVNARFWVQSVRKFATAGDSVSREVCLAPVIRPSGVEGADGNVSWSKYTPSGEIRLVITADSAGEWFDSHLGKDVAITFTEA